LAAIRTEIEKLRENVRNEMSAESERLPQETERLVGRIEEQAQQEIGFMTKMATAALRSYSAGLALEMAAQRIQRRMNRETQHVLVDDFIAGLSRTDFQPCGVERK